MKIVGLFASLQSIDLVKSITSDNGLEFAGHEWVVDQLGINYYFADPYASNQRGTNENTNGLIRQYFPKVRDLRYVNDAEIKQAMDRLNLFKL